MENLPVSKLTKRQVKTFTKCNFLHEEHDCKVDLIVQVRFDDECNNGHNTFAITGDIYKTGRRTDSAFISGGCIREDIEKYMPELAHLTKWHLCGSDQPMHYVSNTLYHARTCSHEGKKAGDPVAWDKKLKFVGMPFTFKEFEKGFFKYLQKNKGNFNKIKVEAVPYDGKDSYNYSDNYTLTGFNLNRHNSGFWYGAPFKDKTTAKEFLQALQSHKFRIVKIPTKWATAETPNLKAAQNSAIWPEATIEQLQNKELLKARLPELLNELKTIVESELLGMEF